MKSIVSLLLLGIISSAGLGAEEPKTTKDRNMTITIKSSAFQPGAAIPARFTGDGANVSPPLTWSGVPSDAKSLALICDDPDAPAGTWVHWVLYELPATASDLPEKVPASEALSNNAKQGKNDFQKIGYGGPAPPPGKPHRYYFKLYALDIDPGLKAGATKQELLHAMKGHVLGEGQLMGTYQRKK
jgi:Raf kinase inhibitor-like YbhB/YbcL family protein